MRVHVAKSVGKPDARILHVRFDERGWETGDHHRYRTAPVLDSTQMKLPKALAVIEAHSLVSQLLPQNPILFSKVIDEK